MESVHYNKHNNGEGFKCSPHSFARIPRPGELEGIDGSVFERHELVVRNRREPIVIRTIHDVEQLTRNLNKQQ